MICRARRHELSSSSDIEIGTRASGFELSGLIFSAPLMMAPAWGAVDYYAFYIKENAFCRRYARQQSACRKQDKCHAYDELGRARWTMMALFVHGGAMATMG